ncbi:MAG: hypothetical protein MUE60_08865 [Candidatus Eisenbacteria bacterium]|nr:hypothetical protein [Candidatus Eisenbacteria bacterium]
MRMSAVAVALLAAVALSAGAEPVEQYDAAVVYTDAKSDTVLNVWEYFDRQPVRVLCYIDGDDRPQIPYRDILRITFNRSGSDGRMIAMSIELRDGSTRNGRLWGNDSIFGTTRQGVEWRGHIVNLRSLTFLPSASTSTTGPTEAVPTRRGAGGP